jgi:hypothetical protein
MVTHQAWPCGLFEGSIANGFTGIRTGEMLYCNKK